MLYISPAIRRLIELALDEDDLGFDVTSGIFFADAVGTARLIAKEPMIIAGQEVAREVFARVDAGVSFTSLIPDGERADVGDVVGMVEGPAVSMLRAERTALNFLQRLSGVATLTRTYVDALGGARVRLVDTRKTLPGYRELDKYAVRCGGGHNHRFALSGGVMVKDNHIAAVGSIEEAVLRVRAEAPHTLRVEVEVSSGDDAIRAIDAGAEIVMLDNMGTEAMREAIAQIR
ncbi:MAG: carboxylating nicotinate-nucleotide diphosphorylase, partial [Myxococcota bacterium]